ncbi:uncharacterized protein HKW66_Vig0126920 [Vigna angularis]|uniref:Uncharacterized protein n=1 Tax=Phaseolus angularis TaxID=3914 RepID=A0A8T0K342_PHAAN|nr:uncharacterized protein HKW66_Vig0126920 [Vigna angularis]
MQTATSASTNITDDGTIGRWRCSGWVALGKLSWMGRQWLSIWGFFENNGYSGDAGRLFGTNRHRRRGPSWRGWRHGGWYADGSSAKGFLALRTSY